MKLSEVRKMVLSAKCGSLPITGFCGELPLKLCNISGRYEIFQTVEDLKAFFQAHTPEMHPGMDDLEVYTDVLETKIFWANKRIDEEAARKAAEAEDDSIDVSDCVTEEDLSEAPAGGEYIAPGETRELAPGITMTPQGGGMVMISGDDLKKMGGGSMSEGLRKMQQQSRRNAFLDGLDQAMGGKMPKEVREMLEKDLKEVDEKASHEEDNEDCDCEDCEADECDRTCENCDCKTHDEDCDCDEDEDEDGEYYDHSDEEIPCIDCDRADEACAICPTKADYYKGECPHADMSWEEVCDAELCYRCEHGRLAPHCCARMRKEMDCYSDCRNCECTGA